MTFVHSSEFYIYKINLTSKERQQYEILENDIKNISHYKVKSDIKCDFSNDGEKFLCILTLKNDDNQFIGILYSNYSGKFTQAKKIDNNYNNYFLGNVKKVDDSNNKYLICYEQENSNSIIFLDIKCEYYSLKDGDIIKEESYIVPNIPYNLGGNYDRSLIIHLYENSLFIVTDIPNGQTSSEYLIFNTLDLKANNSQTILFAVWKKITYFFNDDNHYYEIYIIDSTTKIRKMDLMECPNKEYTLERGQKSIELDFLKEYTNTNMEVYFSLNPSISIYKNGDGSPLIVGDNQHIILSTSLSYSIGKNVENGIFNNYYYFSKGTEFSLVCQMKVIICYKSCSTCNPRINSTSTNKYCTVCGENYFPIYSEKNNSDGFNCYSQNDEKISNYYLDKKSNSFFPCDISCKSCINNYSCTLCKDEYYFKAYENNTIKFEEKCVNSTPESYYLYINFNEKIQNETIKYVYKPCYKACKTCDGPGNYISNACTSCIDGLMNYEFNIQQCTLNSSECIIKHEYWKLEDNEIKCINECNGHVVISGDNRGQCVDDCQNYTNPYTIKQNSFLLPYECEGNKYCIPFYDCYRGNFYITNDGKTCERSKNCIKIDIFNETQDPFVTEPEEEEEIINPVDYESKIKDMDTRMKIIKMQTANKVNDVDSKILKEFNDTSIIYNYSALLLNEEATKRNVYLVTSTKYTNYTITIYPLDIENYTYHQVFLTNNLGFVNFTKMYPNFINYELNKSRLILVCTLERLNDNSSIKDINYYLYSFKEKNETSTKDLRKKIKMNEKDELLLNASSQLELLYPLYNYINESSLVNKRNSENLVENIKFFNEKYPKVELYNLKDPFYNDICFLFTSDKGTDMTLNDRRNEYYVNISLCEKNCTLIKVININSKPRAVCNCNIKYDLFFYYKKGLKDEITPYHVQNSKSFICISETFNFNLTKNGNFWIFIIILIFQVYLLINYIKHKDNIVNRMLGLFDNNAQINKELVMSSSDGSNFVYEYKNNDIEKNYNDNNDNNNKINNTDYKNISHREEIISAPVNVSHPPKRKIDSKKDNNISTKTDIKKDEKEKDLISGNSSLIKGSNIQLNDKNRIEYTDISFDDLHEGYEPFRIDNLIEQKDKMLQDNYLRDPIIQERLKKMKKIKKSLRPLNPKDKFKYFETCEDIIYPNQNENYNNKKHKKIREQLDGKDLFKSNLIENYSDNENNERYPKTKIKKGENLDEEENGVLGEEIIFPKSIVKAEVKFLVDEGENKNRVRVSKNNNVDDLFDNDFKNNNNNTLVRPLRKKEINKLKVEEEKYYDERLKTEIENDGKNKIKSELQKISKDNRPYSSVGIYAKNRKKINKSIDSDFNDLIKKSTAEPLKLRDKRQNKNINKESSKESESKRMMIRFQEEGEMVGDMGAQKLDEENLKKKRARNLELLKEKTFFTTMTELLETDNKEILVEENFFLFYWKYLMKREIWILTLYNKNENIPYFVSYSFLAFFISFLFLFNCFFFFESDVHNRYIKALYGKKIVIGGKEFGKSLCVSLIGNVVKMVIIKLVLYKIFKIGKTAKRMMRASAENGLNPDEIQQLNLKRQNYLKNYKKSLLIYFICLMALNIFFAYICICYAGVFINSQGAFILGLLFSIIFSFIFCALICLFIVSLYRLGKKKNSKCIISAYIVLSALY